MAFMAWKDEYAKGIERVDRQHKHLIELIARLHEAMKAGKGER
jgi:hemerythrin